MVTRLAIQLSVALFFAIATPVAAIAQTTPTTPTMSTPAAVDSDAQPKKNVEDRLGIKVDSVTPIPMSGLYEIRVGNEVVYTDAKGDYLLKGDIIDLRSHSNITAERVASLVEASLPKVKLADLPLSSAIKIVKGNGKRTVVAFEDPNCGYCKRLEKSFENINDVTLYVFLYPILGDDSVTKAKAIWCAPNRAQAWQDWMKNGTPLGTKTNCENPIQQNVELGEKLAVTGTPTMFFASGKRIPGAVGPDEVAQQLAVQ